jgi:tetratricopeptide (TPR) repeat protein
MSDIPHPESLARQLSARWQIPLLILSAGLLAVGIWRLRPRPAPPTFEQLLGDVHALVNSGFYPEASKYAEELLAAPERTPEQRRQLHRELARIIFEFEQKNAVHGVGNVERIITHSDQSLAPGESHDAQMHRIRALAWEWLQRPADALAEYRQAVAAGIEGSWEIRKRMIEIRRSTEGVTAEELHQAFDAFLKEPGVSEDLQFWAASEKVALFGREGENARAERFLADNAARFRESKYSGEFDYLQALAWFHLGRMDDAERLLRSLRDRLSWADPTYVCASWLLGKILQAHEAPEFALSFYDDVLDKAGPGPYRTASILGRGEVLAGLDRFSESLSAYQEAIQKTTENPYGTLVDLRDIRESSTGTYQALSQRGRLAEARSYLQIGIRLVPPADVEKQAVYAQWLADLDVTLGREAAARARDDSSEQAAREAKAYLQEAGQEYLRLAKLAALDEFRSSQATWKAADAFDEAGDHRQAAAVLGRFVGERPTSSRVPEALNRLGQTCQALGEYDQAIIRYQQNLSLYPGTPSAVASIVPLADCFTEKGELDKAEEALLRLVAYRAGESLRSVTPEAREYREALFRLGDLYVRGRKYEQAISRYDQALKLYPDDPRNDRVTFMLAEAHRLSALGVYNDFADPKNIAQKDHLRATYIERLKQARRLYDQVIDRYRPRDASTLSELDKLYLKLSHFYRADSVYDLSRMLDPGDLSPFVDSLELYDRAAWIYQDDPMAMSAYIQMINCYLRGGKIDKARMTLQRARWALKGVSDEAFARYAPDEDRKYWEAYLTWLEKTPTFSIVASGLTEADAGAR